MAYFEISDFKLGVDVRRSRYTSVPGTLQKLVNAHITRGGDVERRKAFVHKGRLSGNTFGLAADQRGLVTFGSDPGPWDPLPPGIGLRYQRLIAPSGADMVSVDAVEQFGGKLYVVATFSDGIQWHFYDAQVVGDWGGGVARADMTNNEGIAESLRTLINAGGIYTATRSGTTLTITGPEGVDFDVAAATENRDGGNPNQQIILGDVQEARVAVPEQQAIGAFSVIAGKPGAGNTVSRVTLYRPGSSSIQLISDPVPFTVNSRSTAVAVAAAINDRASVHGHTARAHLGSVLITAPPGQGASANGRGVEVEVDGEVCLAEAAININAGSGSTDQLISIRVNGKPATGDPVEWATSNSATAAAVAAEVNSFASDPKMVAVAIGETVYLAPKVVRSDDPSTVTVMVTTEGEFGTGEGPPPPEGPPGGGGGGFDPRPRPPGPEDGIQVR